MILKTKSNLNLEGTITGSMRCSSTRTMTSMTRQQTPWWCHPQCILHPGPCIRAPGRPCGPDVTEAHSPIAFAHDQWSTWCCHTVSRDVYLPLSPFSVSFQKESQSPRFLMIMQKAAGFLFCFERLFDSFRHKISWLSALDGLWWPCITT